MEAIDKLSWDTNVALMKRIKLAETHYISSWLIRGYTALVQHSQKITVKEAEQVGWHVAIELCGLREQRLLKSDSFNVESALRSTFASDIAKIEEQEAKYGPLAKVQGEAAGSLASGSANSVNAESFARPETSAMSTSEAVSPVERTSNNTPFTLHVSLSSCIGFRSEDRDALTSQIVSTRCVLKLWTQQWSQQPNLSEPTSAPRWNAMPAPTWWQRNPLNCPRL